MPDFWKCEAYSEPKHALLLQYLSAGPPRNKGLLTLVQKLAIRIPNSCHASQTSLASDPLPLVLK
jgi:hypothetical protein